MGYINHSFLIRIAVFGGTLSLLPLPVLAKILTDGPTTPSVTQVGSMPDESHKSLFNPVLLNSLPNSEDVFAPAAIVSVPSKTFVAQSVMDYGVSQLTQVSQLPTLPPDAEPGGDSDGDSESVEPPTNESNGQVDSVDVDIDDASSEDASPGAPVVSDTGEIVPDTGQAESTASDDLLDTSDFPPTELLADPNPLNVPTLEAEVTLPEGDKQIISLEEAIELAYFNNQDLQAALLELEQAEATLAESRAAFSPVVSGSANVTTQETESTQTLFGQVGNDGTDTTVNAALQVTYDVFTSGQRISTLRAAKEQVRLSELEVDRRREELRLNTTTLYYDLQESGEQIRINQAFVDEATRNRRDNALRQEAGVGTTFDVLRADVQLANAQQDLIQSQAQQRIARRNLARLLNLPSTVDINATPVPAPENWEATYERWSLTLEDSVLLAFQSRVELEQQLAQREIGLQQARAARAAVKPQVSLFANYTWSDFFDNSSDNYNFGAQLNWLLVDGGAAYARARQQEASAAIAEERFSEVLDQVRFEVEQAYFTMRSNEENVRTARTAINQAVRALELANLRLDAGVGTQLDVLTAQSELTQAEGNWVSAALGYSRALASLQRAVSNLRSTL